MFSVPFFATLLSGVAVQAADFTVTSGVTDTTGKTLTAGETGTVEAGGVLNVTTAHAIAASGNGTSVTNNGTITTSAIFKRGISSASSNGTITNNGTITTTGTSAAGIYLGSGATNSTLINSGTITSSASYGIQSSAAGAMITNSGKVTTTAAGQSAIYASGTNATITNNGTLTSTGAGAGARGIYVEGVGVTVINNGTITAADSGILSNSTSATTTNNGKITAGGNGIYGGKTTINSGTVTSTGGYGIYMSTNGGEVIITQSGTVSITGAGKSAIYASGTNGTITISGTVIASGAATQAIYGEDNQTLNIMPGATIIGTIDLGAGGTNAVNVYTTSGARSSTLTIANAGTVNLSGGGDGLVLQSGTTVAVVDPTALAASRAGLGATTVGIHQSVSQQLARSNKPQAVQVAASELEPGMLYQEQMPFAWGQIFGGHKKRGDDGAALAYTSNTVGAIGGYERSIGEHSIGVFGGTSQSTMKTDVTSLKTNSDGFFVGGYGEYAIDAWPGNWALDGTLVAGYQRHDNQRLVVDNLKGEETARSDYHSVYISPSVALIRTLDMGDGLVLRPSAEVNYTYGYYGRYSETGTTSSNLTVEGHGVDVVNTRLQLAVRQPFARGQGELELRGGATYSYLGRDSTDISLNNGAVVHYRGTGDSRSRGGYVGANARYDVGMQLALVADMEYGRASRDAESITGHVGLEYRY